MSLSTALSLETLAPEEIFAMTERDMGELTVFYDENGNGVLELDEFTSLVTEVLLRMQSQLSVQIPSKYCQEHGLPPAALDGLESRINDKFKTISRTVLAKKMFDELDAELHRGYLEPDQLRALHRLMETHVLKDIYEGIGAVMVQKLMERVG